jgi:ABC-2 type transport system permease protein
MAEPAHEPRGPLWELTVFRIKDAARDPMALFWTFVFPIFVAIGLGLAFRSEAPAAERVAFACTADGGDCQALAQRLRLEPRIAVSDATRQAALTDLSRGKFALVLEVGRSEGGAPAVTYHYDPMRKEAHLARLAAQRAIEQGGARGLGRDQLHERPGGRYIDYLMPGIVALNLMGSGVWGIGLSIVESRRKRLMRQFATTPMRRSHFLISYMLSRLLFLVPEVAFLLAFGALAFGTPMQGSLLAIALLSLIGALAFTGLGLLVGARAQSAEAAAGWANFVMMPMWLFSGVFFSYELFPETLHPLIRALPLTALSDAFRAVLNEAAPLAACAPELAVLLLWTVGSFAVALRLFRWT